VGKKENTIGEKKKGRKETHSPQVEGTAGDKEERVLRKHHVKFPLASGQGNVRPGPGNDDQALSSAQTSE